MTLRELLGLEAKQAKLRAGAEQWLLTALRALEAAMLREALAQGARFVFRGGKLALTVTNTRRAASAALAVEGLYRAGLKQIAAGVVARILRLLRGQRGYFQNFGDAASVEEKAVRQILMAYGFDPATRLLVRGGYMDSVLQSAPVARAVGMRMNAALLQGMGVEDFRRAFLADFAPAQGAGMLERHFKRLTHDLFMQVDRAAKDLYAEELGMNHFVYAGTEVERSRDFCIRRMNRIYTVDFSDGWDDEQWAGKIPGLPFRIQMGGRWCRHSKMYISDEMADMLAAKRGQPINTLGPGRVE